MVTVPREEKYTFRHILDTKTDYLHVKVNSRLLVLLIFIVIRVTDLLKGAEILNSIFLSEESVSSSLDYI